MTCTIDREQIERSISFHGHWCPGLAIDIRAAEWALGELGGRAEDEELVAMVETDMCTVATGDGVAQANSSILLTILFQISGL